MAFGDELRAVIGDDAGGFLTAMLERVQAQHRQRARIRVAENAEDAAFFMQRVAVEGRVVAKAGHGFPSSDLSVFSMRLSSARRSSAP